MTPLISVVVPTFDRPRSLASCLEALALQTLARETYEVIVVDDGTSCDLDEILEPYRPRLRTKLLRQVHNAGPAAARNRGVEAAEGEIIALTDDDCQPRPDWLERLQDRLASEGDSCLVGGRVVNLLPDNVFSEASHVILGLVYDFYNPDPRNSYFFASMNVGLPRAELIACGGFDAAFRTAEDRELCHRWRSTGRRLVYAPEVVVGHAHDLDVRSFCRQHLGYGRGGYDYHRARGKAVSRSMLAESGFHLALPRLTLRRLRGRGVRRIAPLLGALALWQACNTAGFLAARLRLAAARPDPG